MKSPFWIIGPPRSGSTFWTHVIDKHPQVFVTSESRVMTFMYRTCTGILQPDHWPAWMEGGIHGRWTTHIKGYTKEIVETFYESLGATEDQRWGDKFPHYADPHPDEGLLQFIVDTWPDAQFIYLTRNEGDVVRSVVKKGWLLEEGAKNMVRSIDQHVNRFFATDESNLLRVRYEDDKKETLKRVFDFLGVGESEEASSFLEQQEADPTPFSRPTSWKKQT